MTPFFLAATAYYHLLPTGWGIPPACADAVLLILWLFDLLLAMVVLGQGLLQRRRMRQALPDQLDLLVAPYPRWPGMEALFGVCGLLLCLPAAWGMGRPGVWQGAFLSAYLLGMLAHRHFNLVAGLAATTLTTIGSLGLPLALASVLAGPDSPTPLIRRQVLLLGGFTSLIAALVWAVCAGQWARQQVHGRPISTAHKMTWPALIQAMAGLILAAFCLAPAFQRGS